MMEKIKQLEDSEVAHVHTLTHTLQPPIALYQ